MRGSLWCRMVVGCLFAAAISPCVSAGDAALGPIHELEKMNHQIHQMKTVPESVTEDYMTQVQTVANLHDPRAVPALVGAIETGDLAMQGLASLGDAALGPVISVTKEKEMVRIYAALQTLSLMLDTDHLKHFKHAEAVKEKIKQTLLPLQNNQDPILMRDVKEILTKIDEESPVRMDSPENSPPTY